MYVYTCAYVYICILISTLQHSFRTRRQGEIVDEIEHLRYPYVYSSYTLTHTNAYTYIYKCVYMCAYVNICICT